MRRLISLPSLRKVGVLCVTQGQHQPATSYHSLYAGTVATFNRFATAAAYTARATATTAPLTHFSFDITFTSTPYRSQLACRLLH